MSKISSPPSLAPTGQFQKGANDAVWVEYHNAEKMPAFLSRDAVESLRYTDDNDKSLAPSLDSSENETEIEPFEAEEHQQVNVDPYLAIEPFRPTSSPANFNVSRFLFFAANLFFAKEYVHQRSELLVLRSEVAFTRHLNHADSSSNSNTYENDIKFLLAEIQQQEDDSANSVNMLKDQLRKMDSTNKSSDMMYANDINYLLSEFEEQEKEIVRQKDIVSDMEKKLQKAKSFFRLSILAIQEFKRKLF